MQYLSHTTDYFIDTGYPEPYLKRIAKAGFSHVHWCHHWCDDFIYEESEINQIKKWLKEYNLKVLDIHGTAGKEKNWFSSKECERIAGISLVKNRIKMAKSLNADVVVMHVGNANKYLFKSLDQLKYFCKINNVRIAVENNEPEVIQKVINNYSPDYIGICYDSGHGNIGKLGINNTMLKWLDKNKNRLIALHLHDNNGKFDQHRIPFTGTVNWEMLTKIIAESSYKKCISLEANMRNVKFKGTETEYLKAAFKAAKKLSDMVKTWKML